MVVAGVLMQGCVMGVDEAPPPLQITASRPIQGDILPADAVIELDFDRYLSPRRGYDGAVILTSGELSIGVRVGYDPVGPGLRVVPRIDLPPGLGYTLTVRAEAIEGLDGARLPEDVIIEFSAGTASGRIKETPPVDFESEIAPALRAGCRCHGPEAEGPEAGQYPRLLPETLINQPSRLMSPRLLVDPGRPLASQLILKVLPDHPGRGGLQMPAEGPLLDEATLRDLVSWVEQLGRR